MRVRAWLIAGVMLAARQAAADPGGQGQGAPTPQCSVEATTPKDGSTAVSALALVTYRMSSSCYTDDGSPELLDDAGKPVAFTRTASKTSEGFELVPNQPLVEGWYTVRFGRPVGSSQLCEGTTRETKEMRFRVGAAPQLAAVDFVTVGTSLDGLMIRLSEPVAAGVAPKDYFQVTGPTPSEVYFMDTSTLFWSFKGLSTQERPTTKDQFVVSVSKKLPFASEASLAKDEQVTLVPADYVHGWKPGASPCRMTSAAGCSSAGGGLAPLVAIALVGLGLHRRRRG